MRAQRVLGTSFDDTTRNIYNKLVQRSTGDSTSRRAFRFYSWLFLAHIGPHASEIKVFAHRKRSLLRAWYAQVNSDKMSRRTELMAIRFFRIKRKRKIFAILRKTKRNRHRSCCMKLPY